MKLIAFESSNNKTDPAHLPPEFISWQKQDKGVGEKILVEGIHLDKV